MAISADWQPYRVRLSRPETTRTSLRYFESTALVFNRPVRIRWWIFAFTLAFPMLSYIQRLSVQDMAPTIMPALHLSQLQIGWLATAFTTAYALAQVPGGIFSQRVGARWALVVVGILGFVATLAFPLAPMILAGTALFGVLLFAQALLGASQGP